MLILAKAAALLLGIFVFALLLIAKILVTIFILGVIAGVSIALFVRGDAKPNGTLT